MIQECKNPIVEDDIRWIFVVGEAWMAGGNKRRIGAEYEEKAVQYLRENGYTVIETNHRNKCGELDIIARDASGVLIILEVKYRSSGFYGDPLEAVDWRKQRRICRATLWYYMVHGYSMDMPCRFDVIAIYGNGELRHIEAAFEFIG